MSKKDKLDETHSCYECVHTDVWIITKPCCICIHNPNHGCHFKKKE